jgi:hypothetical protein
MTVVKRKPKKCTGPERMTVNHIKDRDAVFICFYDGCLSGSLEITPEQAIAIGDYGNMAKVYREEMEKLVASQDGSQGNSGEG